MNKSRRLVFGGARPKITREINMSSLRIFVSHLYIRLKYLTLVPLLFSAMTLVPPSSALASTLPSDINTGGYVLMIRHALSLIHI